MASFAGTAVTAHAATAEVRSVTPRSAEVCVTGDLPAGTRNVVSSGATVLAASTAPCQTVANLIPTMPYVLRVSSGDSALGDEALPVVGSVSFTTPSGPGSPPIVRNVTDTSAEICPSATYRSDATFSYEAVAAVGPSSAPIEGCFTATGLERGSTYFYRLYVRNAASNAPQGFLEGSVWFDTTDALAPPKLYLKDQGQTSTWVCAPERDRGPGAKRFVLDEVGQYATWRVGESTDRCVFAPTGYNGQVSRFTMFYGPVGGNDASLVEEARIVVIAPKYSGYGFGDSGLYPNGGRLCMGSENGDPVPAFDVELRIGDVVVGGGAVDDDLNCLSWTADFLTPSTAYVVKQYVAPAGSSEPLKLLDSRQLTTLPTSSGTTTASNITQTGARICTNARGISAPTSVWNRGTKLAESASLCNTVSGLAPGTRYILDVKASAAGSPNVNWGVVGFTTLGTAGPTPVPTPKPSPSPTPAPTPSPTPAPVDTETQTYGFALSGSTSLKTLTKGSLPLSGSASIALGLPSGRFLGDFTLAQSTGSLTALGFLPVSAKVNMLPTEKVSGTLKDARLTAIAKVRIKLPSVKTLGIELAGGANCQAKQISSMTLTSTRPTFEPQSGGPIAGTFAISDLSGCGFLTGIVSPLTSGSGNLIAMNLSPAAA